MLLSDVLLNSSDWLKPNTVTTNGICIVSFILWGGVEGGRCCCCFVFCGMDAPGMIPLLLQRITSLSLSKSRPAVLISVLSQHLTVNFSRLHSLCPKKSQRSARPQGRAPCLKVKEFGGRTLRCAFSSHPSATASVRYSVGF